MQRVQLASIFSFSFLLIIILEGIGTVSTSPVNGGRGPPTVRVSLNDDEEIVTVPDFIPDLKRFVVDRPREVFNAKILDDVNWACFFEKPWDWTPSSPASPSSSLTQSGGDDYTVFSRVFLYDDDPDARETFDPPFRYESLICFKLPPPSRVNDDVIVFSESSVAGIGTATEIRPFPLPQYGIAPNRAHIAYNRRSDSFGRPQTLRRSAIVYTPPRALSVTCYALDRRPVPQSSFVEGVPFSPGNPFVGGLEDWTVTGCRVIDYR